MYETPAEIRALRTFERRRGRHVDGARSDHRASLRHEGVLGISCITNMAAGILDQKPDHSEVMDMARKTEKAFIRLVSRS